MLNVVWQAALPKYKTEDKERIINIQHCGIISDSKHSLYNVPMRK